MRKVVIKISQGSVVTQTVLGGYTSSSCKFPMLYICQKLWKLAESRQSNCNEHCVQLFWPTRGIHVYVLYSVSRGAPDLDPDPAGYPVFFQDPVWSGSSRILKYGIRCIPKRQCSYRVSTCCVLRWQWRVASLMRWNLSTSATLSPVTTFHRRHHCLPCNVVQ